MQDTVFMRVSFFGRPAAFSGESVRILTVDAGLSLFLTTVNMNSVLFNMVNSVDFS